MQIRILITDKYLNEGRRRIFEVQKVNGEPIDFYNDLLYSKPIMNVEQIPLFLKSVIEGECDYNGSGFSVGPLAEGEKVWVKKGMVEFYVLDYKILYPLRELVEVSLELAYKSLEAVTVLSLRSKDIVDGAWISSIKESIPKLEEKLNELA